LTFRPVRLSYVDALRGVVPASGELFLLTPKQAFLRFEDLFVSGGSNPDANFYGLMPDEPSSVNEASMAAKTAAGVETFVWIVFIYPSGQA
jgi:hypothetical protein